MPAAIAEVARQAWPVVRDADELHDVLLSLGVAAARACSSRAGWVGVGRRAGARAAARPGPDTLLVAAERVAWVRLALPERRASRRRCRKRSSAGAPRRREEDALRAIVGRLARVPGPDDGGRAGGAHRPAGVARRRSASAQLERVGHARCAAATGPAPRDEEWCDRALLARIHRLTLGRLRREIEPVSAADLMRFFFRWQHVQPGTRLHGRHGLLAVLGQLEGLELPARAWESQVLPARVSGYQPDDLEHLCLGGVDGLGPPARGAAARDDRAAARTRDAPRRSPSCCASDLPWLLAAGRRAADASAARRRRCTRSSSGAARPSPPTSRARTGLAAAAVEGALWTLVAHGLVTGDGVAGLRLLIDPADDARRRALRMLAAVAGRSCRRVAGRCCATRSRTRRTADAERFARLWLRRWGVVLRELLARETCLPPWRELLPRAPPPGGARRGARRALRRRHGGRAVRAARGGRGAARRAPPLGRRRRRCVVAAADPLNLVGIVVPGARVPPATHEVIAYRDGEAVDVGDADAARGVA